MKRASALLMSALMVLGTMVVLQGCGPDDSKPRKSMAVKRAKALEDLSPEERAQKIAEHQEGVRDLWMWPEGEEPRDPWEDATTCDAEMKKKPGLMDANTLVQITWMTSCMKQKGWVLDPDSTLAKSVR